MIAAHMPSYVFRTVLGRISSTLALQMARPVAQLIAPLNCCRDEIRSMMFRITVADRQVPHSV
jgi:hypothetical protein